MARADLLLSLVSAGSSGDYRLFRQTVEALIAEERSKQHHILADRLMEKLNTATPKNDISRFGNEGVRDFLHEVTPFKTIEEIILPESVNSACRELIEEHHRRDILRSYNLEPRHRVLLAGPPGNGKTSLAEALASELMVPLFVVRYEGIIGSYLGETSTRLKQVFDFVRNFSCVLFFDEFEALGKERGDNHETGEIKRVVSSLLLQIDDLPSHVIVVTASNHPELLDRAVWRRFQLRLSLPKPDRMQIEKWISRFQKDFGQQLGYSSKHLSEKLVGLSFAEIEDFGLDIKRRHVLSLPNSDIKSIVRERLNQLENRFKPE